MSHQLTSFSSYSMSRQGSSDSASSAEASSSSSAATTALARPRAPSAPVDFLNNFRPLNTSSSSSNHQKSSSATNHDNGSSNSPTSPSSPVRRRLRRGAISKRSGSSISALPSELERQRFDYARGGGGCGSGSEVEQSDGEDGSMVQQQHQRRSSAVTMDVDEGEEEDEEEEMRNMDQVVERFENERCEDVVDLSSPLANSLALPPLPTPLEQTPLPSITLPSSGDETFGPRHPHSHSSPTQPTCDLPPTPCPTLGPFAEPVSQLAPAPFDGNFPLGQPLLGVSFCSEEGESDVPPCFYPGQTIPTTLLFELPRFTSLPHSLRPVMTMSLVGTLSCPNKPSDTEVEVENKSLINVGVSLEEGLRLWGKDAGFAWEKLSERKKRGRQDPRLGLPGGKYTLPLTVQVPTHPKLPPSFSLPSSSFQISYHLEVNLTIDNPSPTVDSYSPEGELERVTLVSAQRGFTLLPVTLPGAKPELPVLEGLVRSERRRSESRRESLEAMTVDEKSGSWRMSGIELLAGGSAGHGHARTASGGWMDRLSSAFGGGARAGEECRFGSLSANITAVAHRFSAKSDVPTAEHEESFESWSIVPSLPTSTYSPSSTIPLDLTILSPSNFASSSPASPSGTLHVKATLIRREHVFHSSTAPTAHDEDRGLVREEEIVTISSSFALDGLSSSLSSLDGGNKGISLPQISIPLGYGPASTSLWSSGFTTSLTVSPDLITSIDQPAQVHSHCSSRFFLAVALIHSLSHSYPTSSSEAGQTRNLLIPLTIGSVGEPEGARHRRTWRELYLERGDDGRGEETGRMVSGSGIDEEQGWMCPPPSYGEACQERAYVV